MIRSAGAVPIQLLTLLALLPIATPSRAATDKTIVVLPLDVTKTAGKMSPEARASLEEQLRDEAANALSGTGYTVMTGETTLKLLTDNGIDPAKCGEGSCHLDTAKEMHVGKFISGAVQFFEGNYTASVRLIDTRTGNILASVRLRGKTVSALLDEFAKAAPQFFAKSGLLRKVAREDDGGGGTEGKIGGGTADTGAAGPDEFVVRIQSEPAGAVVMLDGRMLCQSTPCSKEIASGEHELTFEKEGYESAREKVQAKKGAAVLAKLPRIAALVTIDTEPAGLAVSIDGKPAGTSPLAARELRPGAHEIVVDDKCFVREGERVVLKKGQDRTVKIAPRPRTASVKIAAEDGSGNAVEGEAEVDGKPLGAVPGTYRVPVCAKELKVKNGNLLASEKLSLQEGKEVAARLRMRSAEASAAAASGAGEKVEPKSGLTFVRIPGGTHPFQRDGRTKNVSVQSFWMGKTAVTVEAYGRCVQAGACSEPNPGAECNWKTHRRDHPINCVDWNQAKAFCDWMGGRLLSEEEREYVASGGEGREYPWGNDPPGARACWDGEGNDLGKGNRKTTCPGGAYPSGASKWGVLDLAGNVWDWTSSDYDAANKVVRGGSWHIDFPGGLRASGSVAWFIPAKWGSSLGLRCGL